MGIFGKGIILESKDEGHIKKRKKTISGDTCCFLAMFNWTCCNVRTGSKHTHTHTIENMMAPVILRHIRSSFMMHFEIMSLFSLSFFFQKCVSLVMAHGWKTGTVCLLIWMLSMTMTAWKTEYIASLNTARFSFCILYSTAERFSTHIS